MTAYQMNAENATNETNWCTMNWSDQFVQEILKVEKSRKYADPAASIGLHLWKDFAGGLFKNKCIFV